MRSFRVVPAVVASGAALTAAVALVPGLRFAYRAQPLHVAIETAAGLVGLLVAFLVYGRAERSRRLVDGILLAALVVLALTNVFLVMLPAVLAAPGGRVFTWSALFGHVLASALLAAAALVRTAHRSGPPPAIVAAAGATVAVDVAVVALVQHHLPLALEQALTPERSGRPDLVGHPAVLVVQLLIGVLYAVASVGFAIRSERRHDGFTAWLAVAAALAALSRVNYVLYPSLYSRWVYTGDFFRLAAYVALLLGALQEITTYWRAAREAAVMEERRRIARDLHDGLAQEVAYMTRAAKLLRDGDVPPELPERLAAAAERAFRESRQVIAALAAPSGEPLAAALERATRDAAARFGVDVELDVSAGVSLDAALADALVRIAGEAVVNAARHSGAQTVHVALEWHGEHLRLRVADDGVGFDATAHADTAGGFGLSSMRERAAAVGADFRLRTAPGMGTRVEVSFR